MFKFFKKSKIIFLVFALFIVTFLFLCLKADNQIYINNNKTLEIENISQVCIKDNCFDVEIADTSEKRKIGLMNREHLALDSGMFFIFEKEGVYRFWTKDTLIPLDIIWINRNRKVVFIKENTELCKIDPCESFGSNKKAKYVLEVNGGIVKETGIEVGDEAMFR